MPIQWPTRFPQINILETRLPCVNRAFPEQTLSPATEYKQASLSSQQTF